MIEQNYFSFLVAKMQKYNYWQLPGDLSFILTGNKNDVLSRIF